MGHLVDLSLYKSLLRTNKPKNIEMMKLVYFLNGTYTIFDVLLSLDISSYLMDTSTVIYVINIKNIENISKFMNIFKDYLLEATFF